MIRLARFNRLGQEQPNMIQRVFSHPLLTGAALGLVGLVAKHALSQHHNTAYQEQYGNQQQPQYGYQQQPPQQYGYNQGFQPDPYAQQQLYQEQQEVQELRSELRQEERREERMEEREHHHHRREEW